MNEIDRTRFGQAEEFCPMHESQDAAARDPAAARGEGQRRDELLLIGALALGFLVLRRLLRLA